MKPSNMLERFYLNNCRRIFRKFLDKNIGSRDVILMGEDGTCIRCHRFVLSACSPFFERAFETFTKANYRAGDGETELVLLLATYKSENIQRMVDYIYHGELPVDLNEPIQRDIDDDFIRLAKELKIGGLHELLMEKRNKRCDDHSPEIIRNDEPFTRCRINDNLTNANGVETLDVEIKNHPHTNGAKASDVKLEPEITHLREKSLELQPNVDGELVKQRSPAKWPEYNNWLRLLSNVRRRQEAKNKTLRDKKPQELLNDVIEGVKYCFSNAPNGEYECQANINGQCFSGKGSNQSAARLECVKTILLNIFNISFDEPLVGAAVSTLPIRTYNQFGDIIECLILDKYRNLMSGNNVRYMGYKVIAGIVKSVDNDPTNVKVISTGTGSKFLYEKNLNSNGNRVHDTHAEVVARRGFIRYIYNQIGQCLGSSNPSNSIFEKGDGKFRLKAGIKFHLYVSTAPCGDARVRSHTNGSDAISSIIPEGQLRTKGQKALTVTKDATPTETNGNVNMSCSAKLLRWNILGVQGAVLSEFIEPIYLTSMVFGEKFNPIHMKRALFGRIETDSIDLPRGFRIVQPELIKVSNTKAKSATYSPNHCVNWNGQGVDVEILESTSGCTIGKDTTKRYSRISKRAMFGEYVKFATKLNQPSAQKYADAKHNAKDYQTAKSILFQIFDNNGLGTWVQKRLRNLDDFTI